MGKLVHIVDGAYAREYELNEGVFKIGRNVDNSIARYSTPLEHI